MAYAFTLKASDIINTVSQDIRSVLGTQGADATILLSFAERVQLELLRTSNWRFLESSVQKFVTQYGQTDYWIGATGSQPVGAWDTGLNLTDVKSIKDDTVYDRSNLRKLTRISPDTAPLIVGMENPDNTYKVEQPRAWMENPDSANLLHIYPPADNSNTSYLPVPVAPQCTTMVAGALANRIYWVTVTFVDSMGNESTASGPTKVFVPANSVLKVKAPQPGIGTGATGIQYNQYKVYAIQSAAISDPKTECVQNGGTAISTASDWTEPNSGLVTGTATPPTSSSIEPVDGYIIEFRYMKQPAALATTGASLQVPDEYKDVLIAGTNWLAFQFLKKHDEAQMWFQVYQNGITSIIRDQNKGPKVDFIRPILP